MHQLRTIYISILILLSGFSMPSFGMVFLSPLPGQVLAPGTTVTVKVGPSSGEVLKEVAFATVDGTAVAGPSTAGTFEAQVKIPEDAVGPEFIAAYATFLDGEVALKYVEVQAAPGPLKELLVFAPPFMNFMGQVIPLEVKGLFEDNVVRELTHPDKGTTYSSSDTDVLGISPTGLIQAKKRGTAQIMVSSHGKSIVRTIHADVPSPPDNQIPIPNAGPDQVVVSQTIVDLSGVESHDADGDPIRYRWEQEKGRVVILRDDDTATPYFMSPRISQEEVLEFSLVVIDSNGATSFSDTVKITVTP